MLALTLGGTTEYLPETDRETAMERYWEACQTGDKSARLKVVPNPVDDDPDDPPPSGGGAAGTTPAGTVSVLAESRIQQQQSWLDMAGFSVPPPLFAPGTRVVPLGDRNFRLERQRVERLPLFRDAADSIAQAVIAEEREDLTIRLSDLTMDVDGQLEVGSQSLALTLPAFLQLGQLVGFGMGSRYLSKKCPPVLRADNVNYQLDAAAEKKDRELVLRTRLDSQGNRHAFAVVTPTYAPVDTDQVLMATAGDLSDAHTEARYDGTGVKATALFMPDHVVDFSAGDIFKAGVKIETDDTGKGRIRVTSVVFRNRCLNLIIIGEGTIETVSRVHRGDREAILTAVKDGVAQARDKVGDFLEAWGHARTIKFEDSAETLTRWVTSGKIKPPGANEKMTVEALLASYRKEPGDSLADLVNAVSRAAHETPSFGMDAREELERQAGQLVMVAR